MVTREKYYITIFCSKTDVYSKLRVNGDNGEIEIEIFEIFEEKKIHIFLHNIPNNL